MRVSGCPVCYLKFMHGLPLCAGPCCTGTDFSFLQNSRFAPSLSQLALWTHIPAVNWLAVCEDDHTFPCRAESEDECGCCCTAL